MTIIGPTLVDMEMLLQTDTKTISVVFLAHGLSYTTGAFVCGLLYERFKPQVQITIVYFLLVMLTAVAPWPGRLGVYIAIMALMSVAMGYVCAGNLIYCYCNSF